MIVICCFAVKKFGPLIGQQFKHFINSCRFTNDVKNPTFFAGNQ